MLEKLEEAGKAMALGFVVVIWAALLGMWFQPFQRVEAALSAAASVETVEALNIHQDPVAILIAAN